MQQPIHPMLWFDTEAKAAAEFYVSVFPNSRITDVSFYGEAGPREADMVLTVSFELNGQLFVALNGGPEFHFDEAISFVITGEDQSEVDRYWEALLAGGGTESQCGWLKDRYGVSWQVVPAGLQQVLGDPDPERAKRAMTAMMGMRKLDIAALRCAAEGEPVSA